MDDGPTWTNDQLEKETMGFGLRYLIQKPDALSDNSNF